MRILFFAFLVSLNYCFAQQQPIEVVELTIKVSPSSTEELYYGFAEGDQILFSFQDIDGKTLKEVEIIEYPSTSKFMDYETKNIENKTINVGSKAVYKFRFKNTHLLRGRICKIKIQRIPVSEETKKFNTAVKWITKQDTIWKSHTEDVVAGYDTIYTQKTKKVILSEEKREEILLDKTERVHSWASTSSDKNWLYFVLPLNSITPYEHKKVIAWAYWIGVGEASAQAWAKNRKVISGAVQGAASIVLSPLGALALGTATSLVLPPAGVGDDVKYTIANSYTNTTQGYAIYDSGKGTAGYRAFNLPSMTQGVYYVTLQNDNYMQGIDVTIKVSAIIEHIKYEDVTYTDTKITARREKKIVSVPSISTNKLPVTFDYISQ